MPDATRPRAARKQAAERAAEVRDAARVLAVEAGLVGVTLRAVAARVGVAPALVAHYEPSMEELVADTFRAIAAAELDEIVAATAPVHAGRTLPDGTALGDRRALPGRTALPGGTARDVSTALPGGAARDVSTAFPGGTARDRLHAVLAAALDASRDDVTAVWVDAWSLSRRNRPLAAAVRAQTDAWQTHVAGIVRDGVDTGEFDDVDVDAVAWLLVGIIDGLNAQSVVHDRHDPARLRAVQRAIDRELGEPAR